MRLRPFSARSRRRSQGQGFVEFALTLPIMVLLFVAVIDFARIYTTIVNVESGAREAADFGTFGSQRWRPADVADTVAEMERRACIATSNLPDYVGNDTTCSNPSFAYVLSGSDCDNPDNEPPCRVTVTLTYAFSVLTPLRLEIFGTEVGFPSTLTFTRDSTFAMTDIQIPGN